MAKTQPDQQPDQQPTLVAPDGRDYVPADAVEATNLKARGYKPKAEDKADDTASAASGGDTSSRRRTASTDQS